MGSKLREQQTSITFYRWDTQVIRVGATQSSDRDVLRDQITKVTGGTSIDTTVAKYSDLIFDTGADRKPVQRFQ